MDFPWYKPSESIFFGTPMTSRKAPSGLHTIDAVRQAVAVVNGHLKWFQARWRDFYAGDHGRSWWTRLIKHARSKNLFYGRKYTIDITIDEILMMGYHMILEFMGIVYGRYFENGILIMGYNRYWWKKSNMEDSIPLIIPMMRYWWRDIMGFNAIINPWMGMLMIYLQDGVERSRSETPNISVAEKTMVKMVDITN